MFVARIFTVALLVLVLSALPGTADPVHPRGLSDRFAENKPYLNQTRQGSNATMSFDVHTGDLLTSPVHKEAKVISSVRLLIQVVNGTLSMANRTIEGSHAGSSAYKDEGETGQEPEESLDDEEEMEEHTTDSEDAAGGEEIYHISDESGERVNVSLSRGHGTGTRKGSRKTDSGYAGERTKTDTEASAVSAADISERQENDNDEETEEDYECDCEDTEDAENGSDNQAAHPRPGNRTGSHSYGRSSTHKPIHPRQRKKQTVDVKPVMQTTEGYQQLKKDEPENPLYDSSKNGMQASAVHVDDAHATSGTVWPPLRRRSTTKKTAAYAKSGYTSTAKYADISVLEKHERKDQDSKLDEETKHNSAEENEIAEEEDDDDDHDGTSEGGKPQPVCFGDWTKWTGCKPVNQTHSVRERVRFKLLSDADPVPEMNLQSQSCEDSELALIPGLLSEWSIWSDCSRTCDGGIEVRFRSLIGSYVNGSKQEPLTETRSCGLKKCIRIVETPTFLGDWSQWSSCSRSCGGGIRTRYKKCILVSSAEYVSHPNLPVVESVAVPKPRPVPRNQCVTNTSLPTAGIELAGCAISFCAGELALFDQLYLSEVIFTTTLSPVIEYSTTSTPYPTTAEYNTSRNTARLVSSKEHFDDDHDEVTHPSDQVKSPSYLPPVYPSPYVAPQQPPAQQHPAQQPPVVLNYGVAMHPQAPPLGNYPPHLTQAVYPGRPTNYSGPVLRNIQPPVAPLHVNPPMTAYPNAPHYPQTVGSPNGNGPARPMNVSRPAAQNSPPQIPNLPSATAASYAKITENLQARPHDFPVLSAVQPPVPQYIPPRPWNLTAPGPIVQMPIVYDTVAPQAAVSATDGKSANGTTASKVICVSINSTDAKSATAVQYNFINSTGRLLPPAVLSLSGGMRSPAVAPPSPMAPVVMMPAMAPPAPVSYGPPPVQTAPASYGPPPTQRAPVSYGPPPASYQPERMQQAMVAQSSKSAPDPVVNHQQQQPRYMAPVAAAPLDLHRMLQYRDENQLDYSDYDERH